MTISTADSSLDPACLALRSGDAGPVVAAFRAPGESASAILRHLLDSPLDGPVATAFAQIWHDIGSDMPDARMALLKWYVAAETPTRHPARKSALIEVVKRLVALPGLPQTEAGCDLGFVAARAAVECGGPLSLRRDAGQFLRQLVPVWVGPSSPPLRAPMLLAAIQTVELGLLRTMLDHLPDGPFSPDLQRAVDWATGLMIEFAGIDPWLSGLLDRLFQRDPRSPVAAQRKAQVGLHHGKPFAALAPLFHDIRLDPKDVSLKPVLQFALWRARNDNLPAEIDHLTAQLRALDPAWHDSAPPLPQGPLAPTGVPVSADLATLADQAARLATVDLDLASPFTPTVLRAEFNALVQAIARAPVPPDWTLPNILQAAQRLLQIDRREVSWIVHFADAPHAQGQRHYGSVDLRRFPALHHGLMATVAALCRAGLDAAMAGIPSTGNGPMARLAQLHTRACLQIDQTDAAKAFLDQISALGILGDVEAIERDNCHLQTGDMTALAAPPPNRHGSTAHPFLDQPAWSMAEAVDWVTLASDPAIAGQFDMVWPDGQHEEIRHKTPPGRIATARLPGLDLVAEDFVIGPGGHVLRPNTYHTSAEFPWDSAVVVASQKRAIRLRPSSKTNCSAPVLLLEAFEALRWRNYYHWMIPILSRVALAMEHGLLDDRLLVVPDGLSGWMSETLALIGLPPERRFTVPQGQKTHFADALLMSSIEHVSPAAVQALRRRLLTSATDAPHRHLFLSRKGQKLRKLGNEDAIEDMARDMGFQLIAPQDHSVAEQVQLFSQARSIAAVEGAALTNTLFCPPDTRVLAMLCVTDMMPIFNDLSLVLGHHHSKLAGRGLAGDGDANRFQPPFAIDIDLARQSLLWAKEA